MPRDPADFRDRPGISSLNSPPALHGVGGFFRFAGYAAEMPLTRRQIAAVADQLCPLAVELTRHRRDGGPHWIAVSEMHDALRRHGVDLADNDLQAAIAVCVGRHVMKAKGSPPHSISVWQKDWQIDRQPRGTRRR